jgi:hypothetical protein
MLVSLGRDGHRRHPVTGGRLETGVERIEDRFAVRPGPLGQHVDRVDQRRPSGVSSYSTRGGTSA